jgi:hypothetical protein
MPGSLARTLALLLAVTAASGLCAGSAGAQAPPAPRAGPTALEQAREESGVKDRPGTRHELDSGVLRLAASELLAAAQQELELTLTLSRDVAEGTLELTLPRQWIGRSGVSDLPYARVPASGRGSSARAAARRSDRVVRLSFDAGRSGDVASFKLRDAGIPAGRYRLPYRWSERGGSAQRGSVTVIFYAPVREAREREGANAPWDTLMREVNATNDTFTQSETFISVVPGDSRRFVVGANDNDLPGYAAWITNDGGTSFAKAGMSASVRRPVAGQRCS